MTDGLKEKHRNAIIDILAANAHVEKIVLFGSRAMETFTPTSDVDLALFGNSLTLTDHAQLAEAIAELSVPQQVDLLLYNSIKNKKLIEHIKVHGVEWRNISEGLGSDWRTEVVSDLQREGILLVQDGNHGEYRPRPNEFVVTGTNFIRAADMSNGQVIFESASKINEEARRRITKGIGSPGDILLSHKGTVGKTALIPDDAPPFVCSPQTTFWRTLDSDILDRRFLYAYMRSPAFRAQLASRAGETDMAPYVSLTSQRGFSVLLPPIKEQRAIAHILGTLDDKIELNRRMNETLEAMARAIFKSWFVNFDPVRAKAEGRQPYGMDPETAALFPDSFQDSELGPIPKGWILTTIGDEFNLTMGQSPPGSTYNEDGEGLPFFQGRKDFGFRFPKVRIWCSEPKRTAEEGDTLVSVRAPVGDINMADGKCCIGRGVSAARHKSGSRSYTYYLMRELESVFARYEHDGTVFGAINKTQFEGLEIVAIPTETILQFEKFAHFIDQLIMENSAEITTLIKLRDTLLPNLLSGELRVAEAAPLPEEIAIV